METPATTKLKILTGTYTGDGSEGVYLLTFDPDSGTISNDGLVASCQSPAFIAVSKDNKFIYTANETDSSFISAYQWDDENNQMNLLNTQPTGGAWACYIHVNRERNLVAVSNYGTGNILFYPVNVDGSIAGEPTISQHVGSGPHQNQKGPHAHCIRFRDEDHRAFAVDLGIDQILTYPIDEEGNVGEFSTAIILEGGDGPRHLTFHPNGQYAYVVNELSSSVVAMSYDPDTGLMETINRSSTLPEDFEGENHCADIHITDDGRFLYASNRGHNSIAMFSVAADGSITFLGTESVLGDWPRNFTLTPDNGHLIVANQRSGNVVVFDRDEDTGLLNFTGNQLSMSQPVCLMFFN